MASSLRGLKTVAPAEPRRGHYFAPESAQTMNSTEANGAPIPTINATIATTKFNPGNTNLCLGNFPFRYDQSGP